MRVLLAISMKKRCSSAANTSRTQGIVVISPCIRKPYRRVVDSRSVVDFNCWLGNMASHKYFN